MDISEIIEDLICPICLEEFNNPRVLPCHHYYCAVCIDGACADRSILTCPECRNTTPVPSTHAREAFPAAVMVNRLKEKLAKSREQPVAVTNCLEHNSPLKYNCTDCQVTVCPECILTTHNNHNYVLQADVLPCIPQRPPKRIDSRTNPATVPQFPIRHTPISPRNVTTPPVPPFAAPSSHIPPSHTASPPQLPLRNVQKQHAKPDTWYCNIDHSSALEVLRGKEEGTFLCRPHMAEPDPSQIEIHNHTIHLMCGGSIRNIRVLLNTVTGQLHTERGIDFHTLTELVIYYSVHPFRVGYNHEITLKYPVKSAYNHT